MGKTANIWNIATKWVWWKYCNLYICSSSSLVKLWKTTFGSTFCLLPWPQSIDNLCFYEKLYISLYVPFYLRWKPLLERAFEIWICCLKTKWNLCSQTYTYKEYILHLFTHTHIHTAYIIQPRQIQQSQAIIHLFITNKLLRIFNVIGRFVVFHCKSVKRRGGAGTMHAFVWLLQWTNPKRSHNEHNKTTAKNNIQASPVRK